MSLNTKALNALVPRLEKHLSRVVRKTAFAAQALAKSGAPRDTGALANSIYVDAPGISEYAAKKEAVQQANPKAEVFDEIQSGELGEVAAAVSQKEISAFLAVMVHYGVYLEFGTARQPAQPFFLSAVSLVQPDFEKACRQAVKKAATERSGGILVARM